jgi:hypothetical protein
MSTTRRVEADPLTALREELVRAATRRRAGRRRVRRAAVVAAIGVGLLAATAGAAEIAGFSTGVPEVDELLGVEKRPVPAGSPSASEPLSVRIGDGTYRVVAYITARREVCIAEADSRGRGGFGGCPPLADVNRQIERRGVAWFGSSHGEDRRTFQALVAGEVQSIRPQGEGDWKVLMTPPWTPDAPGARPLRLAVVIDDSHLDFDDPAAHRLPELELGYAK